MPGGGRGPGGKAGRVSAVAGPEPVLSRGRGARAAAAVPLGCSFAQVTKRDEDSSLMQLKEEFRSYEALRREHDAQIVHIAMEAGLRISPEQWSSLLYGDLAHKSHMQSIIDKVSPSRGAAPRLPVWRAW